MKTVRYFHIRPIVRRLGRFMVYEKGGATVRVTGDSEDISNVTIQSISCSKDDNFVRRNGRVLASKAPEEVIKLRYLGMHLAEIAEDVEDRCKKPTQDSDYNFALKYFLPK